MMDTQTEKLALFDEQITPVPASPAMEQKQGKKREVDRLRQRRCRDRKRLKKAGKPADVTPILQTVTLFSESRESETASRPGAPFEPSPELSLLLGAFGRLPLDCNPFQSEESAAQFRGEVLRALDAEAREAGILLMDAGKFLDSAFERGAIPKFAPAQWITVPRDVLHSVLSDSKEAVSK